MKNLVQKFLTAQEYEQINAAVEKAEKTTSGEIVCMVHTASYHYPMSNVVGAAALALPAAMALTPLMGGWLWIGTQNMWVFLSILVPAFILGHWVVKHTPWLKKIFISNREMAEEVEEAAVTSFFKHGLYRTKDGTGILIFISVFERKVWVLADRGIDAKVSGDHWRSVVAGITEGIRNNQAAAAICLAVDTIGRTLAEHFPVAPDDINELDNVIVSDS
ncbi:MAG: TPM domain-containing protein [Desulfobacteraceae bacterium]